MTVRPPRPIEPHADDDSDDEAEVVPPAATAGERAAGTEEGTVAAGEGALGARTVTTEGAKTTTAPAITTTLPPPGGSEAKSHSAPRDPLPRDDAVDAVEGARVNDDADAGVVNFKNGWVTAVFAVLIWLFITVMNVANLVLLGIEGGV